MGRGRTNGRKEEGASLVEFAIVLPLLLLLIFGVVEFARAVATHTAVNTVAREGARFGTTIGDSNIDGIPNFADCDQIRSAAKQRAVMVSLTDDDIDVFFDNGPGTDVYADCQGGTEPDAGTVATGDRITVIVSHQFTSAVPLVSLALNNIAFRAEQSRTIFRTITDG